MNGAAPADFVPLFRVIDGAGVPGDAIENPVFVVLLIGGVGQSFNEGTPLFFAMK
ncbi:hypothetical protein [Pseudomonas amygdali]|uniref:hypothetical protein n=1 Tax=Pseudomonas amygdali TaxID=47877 RepID=UPI00244EA582|nr:hypothetical protein [Pseudomonas amygdali]